MPFWGIVGKSGPMLTPNKLILSVRVFYLAATLRENLSISEMLRVQTVRWTDRYTCAISFSLPCSATVTGQIITDFVVYYGCM